MDGHVYLLGCILSLLAALTTLTDALPVKSIQLEKSNRDTSWDYFLFVQQNPSTYCHFRGEWGSTCYFPSNATALTIHGIWPSKTGTKGPNSCNPTAVFESDSIQSLLPRLVKEWTNSRHDEGFYEFWQHEWLKHGTCATGVSSMDSEHDFFSTVLSLFEDRYNYVSALKSHGITPSNTTAYSTDQFNAAFMNTYGVKPFLDCLYSKHEGKQYLLQIELCLQKDFSVVECPPDIFSSYGSCRDTEPIYFMASPYLNTN